MRWWFYGGITLLLIALAKGGMEIWDSYTRDRVNELHPIIRDQVRQVIRELQKQGVYIRITKDGHFRPLSLQEKLYEEYQQGGPLAAPPGDSFHNYGLAVDVVPIVDGQPRWDSEDWETIASVFRKYGFDWGYGLWGADKPHFQKTFGYSTDELKAMAQNQQMIDDRYPNLDVA